MARTVPPRLSHPNVQVSLPILATSRGILLLSSIENSLVSFVPSRSSSDNPSPAGLVNTDRSVRPSRSGAFANRRTHVGKHSSILRLGRFSQECLKVVNGLAVVTGLLIQEPKIQ